MDCVIESNSAHALVLSDANIFVTAVTAFGAVRCFFGQSPGVNDVENFSHHLAGGAFFSLADGHFDQTTAAADINDIASGHALLVGFAGQKAVECNLDAMGFESVFSIG